MDLCHSTISSSGVYDSKLIIDSKEFTAVVNKLRGFFLSKNLNYVYCFVKVFTFQLKIKQLIDYLIGRVQLVLYRQFFYLDEFFCSYND